MGALFVRQAVRADRPAAVALWEALQREHEALDPRYRLAPDAVERWRNDFDGWLQSDEDRVWVAQTPTRLVGLATAHLYLPPPVYVPRLAVYVDDLFVEPAWRGQGLGRQLLTVVRVWAEERGAAEIRAGLLATNAAARAFWAHASGRDFAVTVTLDLAAPA